MTDALAERQVTEADATVRLLVQVCQNLQAGADGKLARISDRENWRIENRERQVLICGGHLHDEVHETAVSGTSIHLEEVVAGTTGPSILDGMYPVANTFTSLMVVGRETNGSLAAIALADDHSAPPAGHIKLRLVHGASTIGPVDVYMFNVGSVFPATPTVANLTFKTASTYPP